MVGTQHCQSKTLAVGEPRTLHVHAFMAHGDVSPDNKQLQVKTEDEMHNTTHRTQLNTQALQLQGTMGLPSLPGHLQQRAEVLVLCLLPDQCLMPWLRVTLCKAACCCKVAGD